MSTFCLPDAPDVNIHDEISWASPLSASLTVSDQVLEAVTVWEWGYMHIMLDKAAVQMMIAVEFLYIFVTLTSQKKKYQFSLAVLQA